MIRLVSGVLLAAAFFALIWFASATVLLVVALAVGVAGGARVRAACSRARRARPCPSDVLADVGRNDRGAVSVRRRSTRRWRPVCCVIAIWVDGGTEVGDEFSRSRARGSRQRVSRPSTSASAWHARRHPCVRRPWCRAASDGDDRRQRLGAVLRRAHVWTSAAGAHTQPEEDDRGRDRRVRVGAGVSRFRRVLPGARRDEPADARDRSASRLLWQASPAICSSRC